MNDISIPIYIESRYKVNRKRIKKAVLETLEKNEIHGPVEVSIAIIGDRKMRSLNKKYRNLDKTTNVLSFSQNEGAKIPKSDKTYLGDVVISYPVVIAEAAQYNKLVDDWTSELVAHGVTHLLGIHH